jgi:hypothetical protein
MQHGNHEADGRRFFLTTPVFDLEQFEKFMRQIGGFAVPVIAEVMLLRNAAMARFINRHFKPGLVPDWVIQKLDKAPDKTRPASSCSPIWPRDSEVMPGVAHHHPGRRRQTATLLGRRQFILAPHRPCGPTRMGRQRMIRRFCRLTRLTVAMRCPLNPILPKAAAPHHF